MAAQARHQHSAAVQRVAAAALWNLTAGHNDNKLRCGEQGARLLVGALETHVRDAAVVEAVLGALATVLPGVVASLAGVWGWEGAGAVVGALREHLQNATAVKRALVVLLLLAKLDAAERRVMLQAGGRQLVLMAAETHAQHDRAPALARRLLDVLQDGASLTAPAKKKSPLKTLRAQPRR